MKHIVMLGAGTLLACATLEPAQAQSQAPYTNTGSANSGNDSLQEVIVTATRDFKPGSLKTDIVKTEVISAAQIERLNAQNVLQALDSNPGIAVQVECPICNVRNITLNNLAGRFTTLMIDGVPLFSSLSSSYGLDSVNARGTQEIDIARGAGASLIAPGALAGAVNIVTRKPTQAELDLSVEGGNQDSRVINAYLGDKLSENWAASFTGSYNQHGQVDGDGNGVSEYTGYRRELAGIALFGDLPGDLEARLRLDYAHENRGGGAMDPGFNFQSIKSDTSGNPFNWSAGPHASSRPDGWYAPDGSGFIPWDAGTGGLAEIIFTRRTDIIGTLEGNVSDKFSWRAAAGYAHNTQDSFYEETTYIAGGNQSYAELSGTYRIGSAQFTGGINYQYEDLRSHGQVADYGDGALSNTYLGEEPTKWGVDDYTYRTPGAFLQYYDKFFDSALETNVSIRDDHNNVFGSIWSPRANLLWHHTAELASRLAVGTGYRAPTSFFEQDHGVLDATYIVRDITHAESSRNLSYALNYSTDRLQVTTSYNYNDIHHYAELVTDQTDSAGRNYTLFTQAGSPVIIQGVDFSASYQVLPGLTPSLGAERFWYQFTPGVLSFSRPNWKAYASVDWDHGPLDLLVRVTTTGPQNLAKFYDYSDNQQYNFDGTPKRNWSPIFSVVDLKASYALNPNWSIYGGVDNAFNYLQVKVESPLYLYADGSYDVTHIWGPFQSRFIYAGVKYSL